MKLPSPKRIYENLTNGGHLTNEEVVFGAIYFKQLSDKLTGCGPVLHLAGNEANRVYFKLYDIAEARGLRFNFAADQSLDQAASPPDTSPINDQLGISWTNTLNQDNLSTLGWCLDSFREMAQRLGYKHFTWSGRVWISETGILVEDLKKK